MSNLTSNNEKVSIIIPLYKSEKFLPKLVKSIISQSYINWECILVDDGSPDRSGAIADDFATKDNRLKVIHQKNRGTCQARNAGIKIATGDFIMLVDGDDWLESDCLAYFLSLIHQTGAEMAMSVNVFTTRDRTQVENDKVEKWTSEDTICNLYYPGIEIGPWNKLYSKKIIDENNIRFSEIWSGEGLNFAARVADASNFVAVGRRKVYNYRLNNVNSGLTHYNVEMGLNSRKNIIKTRSQLSKVTPKIQVAFNWHLWRNSYFVIFLIIATGEFEKYKKEYNANLKYLKSHCLKVFRESNVNKKEKAKILWVSMFPKQYATRNYRNSMKAFVQDKME